MKERCSNTLSTKRIPGHPRTFVLLVYYIITIAFMIEGSSYAEPATRIEDFIVASHYYVISYSKWEENHEIIRVCIDPTHKLFENLGTTLEGKKTSNRTIEVNILNESMDITTCSVCILAKNTSENIRIIQETRNLPILTMSSEEDITKNDGDVFLVSGKPPRINLLTVTNKNITIESSLLGISDVIK
jgi:hypothetical protein